MQCDKSQYCVKSIKVEVYLFCNNYSNQLKNSIDDNIEFAKYADLPQYFKSKTQRTSRIFFVNVGGKG